MTNSIEVVFSFDTTGSMYPCLTQVRRKVKSTVTRLIEEIPEIRIGIIAHGDYCDRNSTYVTKTLDLSRDIDKICQFIETVEPTGGGDAPECYELVLHEAQSLNWTSSATKSFVLIGDDLPHAPKQNPQQLNWREELEKLSNQEVTVYGVQALNRRHATPFYQELANKSGGFHISLDQFSYITDLFLAVCYQQDSTDKLQSYEQEILDSGRMSRGLNKIFNTLLNRESSTHYEAADLRTVSPGRFQVLDVDKDSPIKVFVQENGLTFKTGRGFYEFTKTETIQSQKEIVLMDRNTGDLFEGEAAREMLGLPEGSTARIKPSNLEKYVVFVQSTSYNRKLLGGTRFLYEVEDWTR
ncbi:vWA domain-containing protein [Geitlerinema calcuttense]|uniref:VWA domain-containing protein n=1 Tax=Geitlerinema calcuttense NRMC-F 0142 TaxID=2922238 RepID=A0ABT7M075_9CYAN|nr:vWA domain-containing protein [Geitlerinema calcuttense]MCD8485244.1 VWA domain-containing protein [Desertifilum sp.]MDL5056446.1 vWA domain-containing protein [Geitlerinema calcuttense NRMC-F 0142]